MQLISKIKKRYFELNSFLMLYTFLGYSVFSFSLLYLSYVFFKYLSISQLISDAQNGTSITTTDVSFNVNPILFALASIYSIFFISHTVYGLFLRRKLKRFFDSNGVTYETTNERLVITLPHDPNRLFFYIRCKLGVNIVSEGGKSLSTELSPTAHLSKRDFQFDISNLPAGRFAITGLKISLVDALSFFEMNTIVSLERPYFFIVQRKYRIKEMYLSESLLNDEEGHELIFERPEDSYYSIREYQKGDALKKIHWKNSAKQNKIFVKIPEERYVEHTNIDLVINMYFPQIQKIEYKKALGEYLSVVLESVEKITSEPDLKIRIIINSTSVVIIEDSETKSKQYIRQQILNKAVFQSENRIESLLKSEKLINPILISLPVDESIDPNDFAKLYIVNLGSDLNFNTTVKVIKDMIVGEYNSTPRSISFKTPFRYLANLSRIQEIQNSAEKITNQIKSDKKVTFINAI